MNHSSRYRRNHIVPPSQPRFGAAEAPNPAPPRAGGEGVGGKGFFVRTLLCLSGRGGAVEPIALAGSRWVCGTR